MECKQILGTITMRTGLEIKPNTTKKLTMNSTRDAPSILESQQIEDIDKCIYVGSVVSRAGGSERERVIIG